MFHKKLVEFFFSSSMQFEIYFVEGILERTRFSMFAISDFTNWAWMKCLAQSMLLLIENRDWKHLVSPWPFHLTQNSKTPTRVHRMSISVSCRTSCASASGSLAFCSSCSLLCRIARGARGALWGAATHKYTCTCTRQTTPAWKSRCVSRLAGLDSVAE